MFIKIKVKTDSKEDCVTKTSENSYLVNVRTLAKNNMANRRAVELLRKKFGQHMKVRIINGHRKSSKLISIE